MTTECEVSAVKSVGCEVSAVKSAGSFRMLPFSFRTLVNVVETVL